MDISSGDMRSFGIKSGKEAQVRNDFRLFVSSVENAISTARSAGKSSAQEAGGTAATISGIYNIIYCIRGEKTFSDAIQDTGRDALKYGVDAYVKGAGLTVLNTTLCSQKSQFLQVLGKNNVVGKAISTVAVTGETVTKWGRGDISTETCLLELGDKGCNFAGGQCDGNLCWRLCWRGSAFRADNAFVLNTVACGIVNGDFWLYIKAEHIEQYALAVAQSVPQKRQDCLGQIQALPGTVHGCLTPLFGMHAKATESKPIRALVIGSNAILDVVQRVYNNNKQSRKNT